MGEWGTVTDVVTDGGPVVSVQKGLVSVVIPSTRVDPWLDECISSVLAGTYPSIEVVVVLNGAQPDALPRDHEDPRVRLVRIPERLGLGGSGELGLRLASGEYYARIDADDRMHPDRLLRQVEVLSENPDVALVSSRVGWIDGDGNPVGRFDYPVGDDVRAALCRQNVVPHSSVMMRTTQAREAGGYDPALSQMEDYDFLLRLALRGRVVVLDEELVQYRIHAGQVSRAVRPTGAYVSVVLRRRRDLARALGLSSWQQTRNDVWWLTQQWGMFLYRRVRPMGA